MGITREVRQGEIIPAWYGVAWVRFDRDVTVCLPMPLNLIAAAARAIAKVSGDGTASAGLPG